jgi:type II secretory pathway component GspD/PulD (secretin)
MVLVSGQRMTFKQGTKIPVATGKLDDKSGGETQFTYLDVGMNFDATLSEVANGAILRSKVEQSSVAAEPANIAGVAEPIVRQTVTESVLFLPTGKPVILGSIDIVGSTRHVDIDVTIEPIP